MTLLEQITDSDVAQFLYDNYPVVLFNGRSEGGSRALGNRSILFNPTHPDGKFIINKIKGREQFRPLAASVLEEHAPHWFEMGNKKTSPFMCFSFECKLEKKHIIPSVIHADGTCRIQTVSKNQNLNFYKLISAFYSLSNVPMLLNTSFNLNGEPLVETIDDAIITFKKSEFKLLYVPDLNMALMQ